jgi:chemotaxis protein CheX
LDVGAESEMPAVNELHNTLLEPFISATCLTLHEMASIDAAARSVSRERVERLPAGITAVLGLGAETRGYLLLTFSAQTAAAVAERVLAGVSHELSDEIVRDCIGEIANVVAGQAKALLAETPFRVTLSMPKVVDDPGTELGLPPGLDCQIVSFSSDLGEFTLSLLCV